jgi:hypothetical protein
MRHRALILLTAVLVSGCASVELFNQESPPEYMTQREADFYARGPLQAMPPKKIPKDTFLSLLKKDSGYAFVRLADNRTGYMDFADLKPAPPVAPGVPFDPVIVEEIVEAPLPDFGIVPDEVIGNTATQ